MRTGRLAAVGLSFLAAVVLTTVSNFAPARAMPLAALQSASDNLSVTETVHCWDCGYYRPYRSYYRPYYRPRPYWGGGYYRPYRPYWGGGYGGYYRPRPYYSGYYGGYGGGYGGGYYRGYGGGYYGGYAPPRRYYYVGPSVYWY